VSLAQSSVARSHDKLNDGAGHAHVAEFVAGDLSSSGRSKCGPSIVRDSLLIMSETRAFWAAVTRLTLGWLGSTACEG
jgi:hypothetical protein